MVTVSDCLVIVTHKLFDSEGTALLVSNILEILKEWGGFWEFRSSTFLITLNKSFINTLEFVVLTYL